MTDNPPDPDGRGTVLPCPACDDGEGPCTCDLDGSEWFRPDLSDDDLSWVEPPTPEPQP